MEKSVGEHTAEFSQPCRKGAAHGKITALEEAYEGCRSHVWEERVGKERSKKLKVSALNIIGSLLIIFGFLRIIQAGFEGWIMLGLGASLIVAELFRLPEQIPSLFLNCKEHIQQTYRNWSDSKDIAPRVAFRNRTASARRSIKFGRMSWAGIITLAFGLILLLLEIITPDPSEYFPVILVVISAGVIVTVLGMFGRSPLSMGALSGFDSSRKEFTRGVAIARPILDVIFGGILAVISVAVAGSADDFPYVTHPNGLSIFFTLTLVLSVITIGFGVYAIMNPERLHRANTWLGIATIGVGFLFWFIGGSFAQTGAGDYLATGFTIFFISLPFVLFGSTLAIVSLAVSRKARRWTSVEKSETGSQWK